VTVSSHDHKGMTYGGQNDWKKWEKIVGGLVSLQKTNLPNGSMRMRFGLGRGYQRWSLVGGSRMRWRYSSELLTSSSIVEMDWHKY